MITPAEGWTRADVEVVYVAEESLGRCCIGLEWGDMVEMGGVDDVDGEPSSENANLVWTHGELTPLQLPWTLIRQLTTKTEAVRRAGLTTDVIPVSECIENQ